MATAEATNTVEAPEEPTSSLFERLAFSESRSLIAAVCDVHDYFHTNKLYPGAEKWVMDTRYYRPQMCDHVCKRWCEITGRESYEFPFHHDFVARVWVSFRKEDNKSKQAIRREISGA